MEYKIEPKVSVCPYLGLNSDPQTALSFASKENFCYHGKAPKEIRQDHQEEFCLNGNFHGCKEYISDPSAPLPEQKIILSQKPTQNASGGKQVIFGVLLSIVGIIVTWFLISNWAAPVSGIQTPTGFHLSTHTMGQLVPTSTGILHTPSLHQMTTLAPRLALGMETPLGIGHHFVIHRIQSGESLEFIAQQYGTTVEALQDCNYQLPSPLLPGLVIVVPVSFTDTREFPKFKPYEVLADIYLSDLSIQLMVDLEDLEYYNGFDRDIKLQVGDWILVPQPTPGLP